MHDDALQDPHVPGSHRIETFRGHTGRLMADGGTAEFTGLPAGTCVLDAPDAPAPRQFEVPANGAEQLP